MSVLAVRQFTPQRGSVVRRGEACALAASDPEHAYNLALTIPDGWYRCQAMATIAQHAPEPLSSRAFDQARAAAAAGFDTYQQAGVLAYAITAALARRRRDLADTLLADALRLVPWVEPMASRAFALNMLWSTVAHGGDFLMRQAVIKAAKQHCHPDRSWRARVLYRDMSDWLFARNPSEAFALIAAMPFGKSRAYLLRRYAAKLRAED